YNGVQDVAATIPNAGTGTVRTAIDRGIAGVAVTAFDSSGAVKGTTTTAANGTYTLTIGALGPYRVEFQNLPRGYSSRTDGADNPSAVRFLPDGTTTGLNFGVAVPAQYSVNNPDIVTPCYVLGDQIAGPNADSPVIVDFPYSAGTAYNDQ